MLADTNAAIATPLGEDGLAIRRSRSDRPMVAVGFNPRTRARRGARRVATLERGETLARANGRMAQTSRCDARGRRAGPWAEAHGYPHGLATRGAHGAPPRQPETLNMKP